MYIFIYIYTSLTSIPPTLPLLSFDHFLSDQCRAQTGSIAWNLMDDRAIVALVSESKKVTTLAEMICDVTRVRGVTDMRMTDHSLVPKMKAH